MGTIIIGTITGLFILALIIFTIKYWGKYTSHILKIFKKCIDEQVFCMLYCILLS